MEKIYNYIDGRTVAPVNGNELDNVDPATGAVYSQLPDSDAEDLAMAVAAAESARENWAQAPAEERARILNRLADLVDDNADDLALAECVDTGKPLHVAARLDIPRVAANLRFYASAATQFFSESHAMGTSAINYTLREPLGTVGCISPWNLPLYLLTWKIAPALAAGNCVIAKPSEVTPMTAYLFSRLLNQAGVPKGVLNVLHGRGNRIGRRIVDHPGISAISFTGGTATGADIAARTAGMFKKLSLELGGKNPTIVFADADQEKALDGALRAAFSNQGQICLCGSRLLVERSIYEDFRDRFVERARALIVGDPLEPGTDQGAVVSAAHFDKVMAAIGRARNEGGQTLCGGESVKPEGRCANGWFIRPTVIEGLDASCKTNQEEIFGPVVSIMPFDDEDDAVAAANSTRYGLAASLWSQDVSRCHRVAAALQSGLVWVNCWMLRDLRTPMGGFKHSGVGREGGFETLRFFTEAKNVCISI